MPDDVEGQVATRGFGGQEILDSLSAFGVQYVPSLDELRELVRVVGDILGDLEIDRRVGTRPATRQIGQVFEPGRRQRRRPWLEMIIPHGLIEDVAVLHLRTEGLLHLLSGGKFIALRVTGVDHVSPCVATQRRYPAQGRKTCLLLVPRIRSCATLPKIAKAHCRSRLGRDTRQRFQTMTDTTQP